MAVSLVTGGAGFIGSHVVDQLVQRGDQVIVLDDLSGGFEQNINPAAHFVHGSITDAALVGKIFSRRIDYVYHLAAYAAEGLSHFIKRFNFENNVIGSINLINAAVNAEVKCFVFTSSIAVYGENELPMREDLVPHPEDSYGIAKYAVELELRASKRMFDLDFVIFRPHNVYGERQNIGDKYRNVLGIFMNQIMRGEPLTIFGDGEQTRAFSYIADVAPHIARAPEVPDARGEIFNVGADSPYTVNQLADEVMKAFDVSLPVRHLGARNEVLHAYCSHDKFRRVFDVDGETSLSQGIGCMSDWARTVGPRASQPFGHIEIRKNLPASWNDTNG
jgi:UDP-glucose 4-epimerase